LGVACIITPKQGEVVAVVVVIVVFVVNISLEMIYQGFTHVLENKVVEVEKGVFWCSLIYLSLLSPLCDENRASLWGSKVYFCFGAFHPPINSKLSTTCPHTYPHHLSKQNIHDFWNWSFWGCVRACCGFGSGGWTSGFARLHQIVHFGEVKNYFKS